MVHSPVLATMDIREMGSRAKVSGTLCSVRADAYFTYILYTTDINECSSNPCDTNAMCTDVPGSFTCACNSGYSGDGFTCQS